MTKSNLKLKHSEQQEVHYKKSWQSSMKEVQSRVYDNIDEALVMKAAMKKKVAVFQQGLTQIICAEY